MIKQTKSKKAFMSILVAFAMLATVLLNSSVILADDMPTQEPPVEEPVIEPTTEPTEPPLEDPTEEPTLEPTEEPTLEPIPTELPEVVPLVVEDEGGKVIPGQYIVVYKEGKGGAQVISAAQAMATEAGGEILFTYLDSIEGFAAKLSDEALHLLRQDERIDYIEADQMVSINQEQGPNEQATQVSPPSWGLDRIDQPYLPLDELFLYVTSAGAGVNIYIIDSGIRNTHQEYSGRVTLAFDAIQDATAYAYDCHGHGTHVAGTAAGTNVGVAKLANLHSVRVLNCDGWGAWSQIIAGINWVAANHVKPAVANMSLGGWKSPSIDKAVGAAIKKGVTFVVAAGNDDMNACNFSPARAAAAITVGATNSSDFRAYFSNYGSCLDLFAPGVAIYSSTITSNSSYASWPGTSMAAPHVAGAAALYLGVHPNATPAQVAAALIMQSTKNEVLDPKGSPNRLLSVSSEIPPAPVLASPANKALTNDNTVTLEWKTSYMNNSYQVQVDDDKYFGSENYTTMTSDLFATTSPLGDGLWYWRVRARNAYGSQGPWSAVRFFTLDTGGPVAPTQLAPLNGMMVTGTPTFKWSKPATALYFQFRYERAAAEGVYPYTSPEIKTTSHKPPVTMVVNEPLRWYVRARDLAGNWSIWSAPFSLTVLPPVPLKPVLAAPAHNAFTNDVTPTMSWNAALYALDYHLQVSTSPTFSSFLLEAEGIGATSATLGFDLGDAKWYWRVRARNANGVYGPFSAPRNFTVDTVQPDPPLQVAPAYGATPTGTPTFSWKAVPGARFYQFQYGISTNPASWVFQSGTFTRTAYKPPVIEPNTNYYWFVRAIDAAGNVGDWSPYSHFMVHPPMPGKVTLVAPVNKVETISTSGELVWQTVDYGHTYHIQIDDLSTFASPNYTYTSGVKANSREVGPLATGKWYWRVRAMNIDGIYGAWSSSRYITIYSSFSTEFDSAGNFQGWEQHPGAVWSVAGGTLQTPALVNWRTSSASYGGANFTDFTYEARMMKNTPDSNETNLYGLVLRGNPVFDSDNDWEDGVYFMAQQSSHVVWGEYTCAIAYRILNNYWYFMGGSCNGEVNWGTYNKLKVYARGSVMKFYINDMYLFSGKASGISSGRLGVVTFGQDADPTYVDWAWAGAPVLPVHYNSTKVAPPYLPTAEEMFERLKAQHEGK